MKVIVIATYSKFLQTPKDVVSQQAACELSEICSGFSDERIFIFYFELEFLNKMFVGSLVGIVS